MRDFETLIYDEQDAVAVVTLNRPDRHNAFDDTMQDELRELWRALRTADHIRAVVLTGAGEKAFCTGIDRDIIEKWLADPDSNRGTGVVSTPYMYDDPGRKINPKQNDLWKPVIAAVNGMACGGALYMLGEADIILAADHATFFDPHVSFGMVAGFESVHLLQKLPLGETLRVALMGAHERMSAQRAHQLGLVSEVVPLADLMTRAMWVANAVAAAPRLASQGTLRSVWLAHDNLRRQALEQVSTFVSLGTQYDNIESGEAAFAGAARPKWELR